MTFTARPDMSVAGGVIITAHEPQIYSHARRTMGDVHWRSAAPALEPLLCFVDRIRQGTSYVRVTKGPDVSDSMRMSRLCLDSGGNREPSMQRLR